ncbi:MAG: hypothetical protein ACI9XK_003834, partial [Granulosicoccus sp.]
SVLAASLVVLVGAIGSWINRRMGLQQNTSEMRAS